MHLTSSCVINKNPVLIHLNKFVRKLYRPIVVYIELVVGDMLSKFKQKGMKSAIITGFVRGHHTVLFSLTTRIYLYKFNYWRYGGETNSFMDDPTSTSRK